MTGECTCCGETCELCPLWESTCFACEKSHNCPPSPGFREAAKGAFIERMPEEMRAVYEGRLTVNGAREVYIERLRAEEPLHVARFVEVVRRIAGEQA